jgi:large subunit ribosomal protein L14e
MRILDLIFLINILYTIHKLSMGYNKFVQVGRVARINYGPLEGKLATIVDIVTDKRVLVDGEGIQRQVIPISRLQLTRQVVKIGRGARTGSVRKIIAKEQVAQNFTKTTLGRHYANQQRRENLTDFERFKVLVLRRRLSKLLRSKKGGK